MVYCYLVDTRVHCTNTEEEERLQQQSIQRSKEQTSNYGNIGKSWCLFRERLPAWNIESRSRRIEEVVVGESFLFVVFAGIFCVKACSLLFSLSKSGAFVCLCV